MSIYSGDFGNVDIKGNIQFAIDYVDQLLEFHIYVAQCKELAVADVKKNRSDPYVKLCLLPPNEKMGKRKTAVRKKTLNPAYNEILRFKINKKTLLTRKLNISVWHNDTFGHNSFLGEVEIDLATWDWKNKQMNWFALQPREEGKNAVYNSSPREIPAPSAGMGLAHMGEMNVALRHTTVPTSGENYGTPVDWMNSTPYEASLWERRINSSDYWAEDTLQVSKSVMNIYSDVFEIVNSKGNIQFAIDYVDQLLEFDIFVAQCKELAVADVIRNSSDPYVMSYLLPDKDKDKRRTAIRMNTLNPIYNETLRYNINKKTLLTQKLNLSVWHNDTFRNNSLLGEVEIDLAAWDWNNKQLNWFTLQPGEEGKNAVYNSSSRETMEEGKNAVYNSSPTETLP